MITGRKEESETIADAADEPPRPDDDLPAAELARRQGVTSILSSRDVDGLAHPELWHSDADYETFPADLYGARRTDLD